MRLIDDWRRQLKSYSFIALCASAALSAGWLAATAKYPDLIPDWAGFTIVLVINAVGGVGRFIDQAGRRDDVE